MGSRTLDVLPRLTEGPQNRNYTLSDTRTNEHSEMKGQNREEQAGPQHRCKNINEFSEYTKTFFSRLEENINRPYLLVTLRTAGYSTAELLS